MRHSLAIFKCSLFKVSIHAPAWGATGMQGNLPFFSSFQSTHPHGVRLGIYNLCRPIQIVSIHAPAWGATLSERLALPYLQEFQSTHPHGVRRLKLLLIVATDVSIHAPAWGATCPLSHIHSHSQFQSTHPHGVRPASNLQLLMLVKFQSTHPHGVRPRMNPTYP